MREIVVISGKGGTGKSSVTGALGYLAKNAVICDLDVDAPDLHLLLQPKNRWERDFYSGYEAIIDQSLCTDCGTCLTMCRFGAVLQGEEGHRIDPMHCEGCKVCVELCPVDAIRFPQRHCGKYFLSDSRFGTFVHAQLFPGEENSGRLVSVLKKLAKEIAIEEGKELVLCDGSPGIGCPVISSLSAASAAVVVTEPTPSGVHDLLRVLELCRHFRVPVGIIVNKYDINIDETQVIRKLCKEQGLRVLAELSYDQSVVDCMLQGKVVTEAPENPMAKMLKHAWENIGALLDAAEEEKNKQPVSI
jgi:MinD superfamily P-loop ATPase